MRLSASAISTLTLVFLPCWQGVVQARLGGSSSVAWPGRRILTTTNSSSTIVCAEGYTCWKEESTGNLWAKYNSPAGGMDCNEMCFTAFAGNQAFYTCKQGTPAPKTINGLSAVAAGLNFNCAENNPNQCWEGMSPPSLTGHILVSPGGTGEGQEISNKNCYLPSDDTLSCTVKVDGANCFGEFFSSVCPCVEEPVLSSAGPTTFSSKKWRLYTHGDYPKDQTNNGWQWDVDDIYFYPTSNCTGPPVNASLVAAATYTDSANAGDWWTPNRAFGGLTGPDNNNRWGGRWDNNVDRNLWVAIEFPTTVSVGCIQLTQFDNFATYFAVEIMQEGTGSTSWEAVQQVTDGQKGANTVPLM